MVQHHANSEIDFPVLVVAYDDTIRTTLAASLVPYNVCTVICTTFCEAEDFARSNPCKAILVDLATVIKAKGEEKIVAYTLTGTFPTLRVKTMGSMYFPTTISADAKQYNGLSDFFTKTCTTFTPRRLRAHKRKDICIPTYIEDKRGFTLNLSWGGIFIVDMNPECFTLSDEITVTLPLFGLDVEVIVVKIQSWGQHRPPGIGVLFKHMDQALETNLFTLLKSDKNKDRDRLVA